MTVECPQCLVEVPSLTSREDHKMDCSEPARKGEVGAPKYPMVEVHLSTGQNGNIGAIMGTVRSALVRAGLGREADKMWAEIFQAESYSESLQIVMRWVQVT